MLSGNTSLDLELNHFFGCKRINSSRTRDFLIVAGLFFAASCKRGEITWYYCSTSCFVLFRCVVDGTDGRTFFFVCFFVLLVGGRGRGDRCWDGFPGWLVGYACGGCRQNDQHNRGIALWSPAMRLF